MEQWAPGLALDELLKYVVWVEKQEKERDLLLASELLPWLNDSILTSRIFQTFCLSDWKWKDFHKNCSAVSILCMCVIERD